MVFVLYSWFGQRVKQKVSSGKSSSSQSTISEIDMADFKKCCTSAQPQNQPMASSDEEVRPGSDTTFKNSTHNDSVNNITLPRAKPYIPVLFTTKPLEPASAWKDLAQPPIKKPMSVGPFGGLTSSIWDDGVYCGVKTINIATGWLVDSITIEYIDQNGDIIKARHGGSGGHTIHRVELDYPNEYLMSIWGRSGRLADGDDINIRSLAFQTNIRTYGPFGAEDGKYFSFPMSGGKVIGFHGRSDHFLKAIGAYMELPSQN